MFFHVILFGDVGYNLVIVRIKLSYNNNIQSSPGQCLRPLPPNGDRAGVQDDRPHRQHQADRRHRGHLPWEGDEEQRPGQCHVQVHQEPGVRQGRRQGALQGGQDQGPWEGDAGLPLRVHQGGGPIDIQNITVIRKPIRRGWVSEQTMALPRDIKAIPLHNIQVCLVLYSWKDFKHLPPHGSCFLGWTRGDSRPVCLDWSVSQPLLYSHKSRGFVSPLAFVYLLNYVTQLSWLCHVYRHIASQPSIIWRPSSQL